ncbi:ATP-binding protein [Streptomyces sp. TRM66268-LWL]|uniref:ATP-binding protein n=1 Tax=Streptomyces polyasparticus TaxID=2767826 RepID=A0ABR7SJX2_9ACTN|nr:ATP-binding protein [Streptomyces polyasparticus]MBC9714776.1 ATP-binding protein [Streptomyces polyasparticus]
MDDAAPSDYLLTDLIRTSVPYEGSSANIAQARDASRTFLVHLQADHGFPVSQRAMDMVQLVVSELVTNACKYAPGPCVLELELRSGRVEVTVWDSEPVLPEVRAPDPRRIGQHGLEIVLTVCQSFEMHREPIGKRIHAAVTLADDPAGAPAGQQL